MRVKKIILFIIIPAFFIVLIGVFFYLNKYKKVVDNITGSDNEQNIQNFPDIGPSKGDKLATDEKINLETASGTIVVKNFKKNGEVVPNGNIYFVDKEKYNIKYDPEYGGFVVTLLASQDIENVRKEAESNFLDALGISQNDACKLRVFLYVSAALTTNEQWYQNHGLSFCSGSKIFN